MAPPGARLPAKGFRPQKAEGREGGGTWSRWGGRGQKDTNASERKTSVDVGAEPDERHRQRKKVQAERWGEHCDQAGLGVPKGSPELVFRPPHIHRGPAQGLTI